MDLFETSEEPDKTAPADGVLNEFPAADQDEGGDKEKAGDQEKGAEEDGLEEEKGPLSDLIDQAKYISQSLDNTLATLMKLKGNIQDANAKIKQNQETSAKAVENLNKIRSDLSCFNSQIADFRGEMERNGGGGGDRACSVDKIMEGSKIQPEDKASEVPIETSA